MIKEVVKKNQNPNPFYGLRYCLQIFQDGGKTISPSILNMAWSEVKDSLEKRQLFWSLLFSIGDITARQHNIFNKNKVDSGGTASRENFVIIVEWMKLNHYKQFLKFMWSRLFNEFVSFDVLLASRIKTEKKKATVLRTYNMIGTDPKHIEELAKFMVTIIKSGSSFDKWLVAKFLTRPRMSVRKNHKKMLPQTKTVMNSRQALLLKISEIAEFPVVKYDKYIDFVGFYQWKKEINRNLESVMFSSGEIKKLDQQQFIAWVSSLPASARFRVRTRLLTKENALKPKWGDLGQWFLEWENYKVEKQSEQRVLEEKVRQDTATIEDKQKLQEVKKEAKVNVGAINYVQLFSEIISGDFDKVKIQPFLDKVVLPYNTLVFVDDSASMSSSYHRTSFGFTPFDLAAMMATICLMKNPDDSGRSMIGLFSNVARIFTSITAYEKSTNAIIRQKAKPVNLPLYEPALDFESNLLNMRGFLTAMRTGNGTNISSIPENLHEWTKGDSGRIEQLQAFPVWTLISDGNFNNLRNATASLNDFMRKCENYFGFRPYLVLIDVAGSTSAPIEMFSGIENVMFIPPNPSQITQFLMNFTDMDIMDIYTPLESVFRSNRYAPIRQSTL